MIEYDADLSELESVEQFAAIEFLFLENKVTFN
jgi:hypothetical protein